MNTDKKKIGEHLVDKGLIREYDILEALERQVKTKAKLGEILLAEGKISAFKFYKELADLKKLPFIDLDRYSVNYVIIEENLQEEYFERQYLPFDQADGRLMIATSDPSAENENYLRDKYGDFDFYVTSPYDILWVLQKRFSEKDTRDAVEQVHENIPNFSSKKSFFNKYVNFALVVAAFIFLFLLNFKGVFYSFLIFANFFFFLVVCSKILFLFCGYKFRDKYIEEENSKTIHENAVYPVYSILVPLFREKERTINQLIKGLKNLDYPQEKLDVKLIVEIDDTDTIEIIKALRPSANFQIVRVPYSNPRTKPKACNYALKYCKGDYVTIFDAEDQPAPDQLKRALKLLSNGGGKVAAVQARLNYYNKDENLLTSLFAIEYASWFDYMLYGLKYLGIPIPLGGSSNHFAKDTLKGLYAWDPYNVTEDADLGVRIESAGLKTELTYSLTLEEAPIKLNNWFKQRIRWLKGYMQTFIVGIRNFSLLKKNIGWNGIMGIFFFIGSPFMIYLLIPMLFLFSLIAFIFGAGVPEWLRGVCLFNLYFGLAVHFLLGAWIVISNRWWSQIFAMFYFPFYWILHCVASYYAFVELIKKPHHWNKTEHGLSSVIPEIMK